MKNTTGMGSIFFYIFKLLIKQYCGSFYNNGMHLDHREYPIRNSGLFLFYENLSIKAQFVQIQLIDISLSVHETLATCFSLDSHDAYLVCSAGGQQF